MIIGPSDVAHTMVWADGDRWADWTPTLCESLEGPLASLGAMVQFGNSDLKSREENPVALYHYVRSVSPVREMPEHISRSYEQTLKRARFLVSICGQLAYDAVEAMRSQGWRF